MLLTVREQCVWSTTSAFGGSPLTVYIRLFGRRYERFELSDAPDRCQIGQGSPIIANGIIKGRLLFSNRLRPESYAPARSPPMSGTWLSVEQIRQRARSVYWPLTGKASAMPSEMARPGLRECPGQSRQWHCGMRQALCNCLAG